MVAAMNTSDIVIIGAGVIGVALARELARYDLKVVVVDKRDDVGGDASKSNSSIICSGFDCPPGTLESSLCLGQRSMIEQVVKELDIPFKPCGAVMAALTREQLSSLPAVIEESFQNGVYDVEPLDAKRVLELEPEINPEVLGGLYIPRDAVIDPFLFVVAQAENAAENGAEFLLNCQVQDIVRENGRVVAVETSLGRIRTNWVVNAAGLFSDDIAEMVGERDFTVKPRKGQFFILDKATPCKISHIVYPVPTKETRGKLILPTVHGNILLGPTSEDLTDKEDHRVTAEGLQAVAAECRQMVPGIRIQDAITQYAGLRPNRNPLGYHIAASKATFGYLGISGIRSTGVSTCLAVAKYAARQLANAGVKLRPKAGHVRERQGIVSFRDAGMGERARLVSTDASYGKVVCRCETVTEAEILQAIRRPVGARSVDAIKRRVRAGMGRCQGGFCGPQILSILARELDQPDTEVTKNLPGSHMLVGNVR